MLGADVGNPSTSEYTAAFQLEKWTASSPSLAAEAGWEISAELAEANSVQGQGCLWGRYHEGRDLLAHSHAPAFVFANNIQTSVTL